MKILGPNTDELTNLDLRLAVDVTQIILTTTNLAYFRFAFCPECEVKEPPIVRQNQVRNDSTTYSLYHAGHTVYLIALKFSGARKGRLTLPHACWAGEQACRQAEEQRSNAEKWCLHLWLATCLVRHGEPGGSASILLNGVSI